MPKQSGIGALSLGLGAAILYLSAHAVRGRQGLVAYMELQAQEAALTEQRDELLAQKATLEARAERLRPDGPIDTDYLEERARVLLGAGATDEIVFALDKG
jgi:cell division protein FtsB